MGPGHFATALVAKPIVPRAPLWVLLAASEALDLLCFGFIAAGIETAAVTQADLTHGIRIITPGSIPWSHGLFMALAWSVLAAGTAYLFTQDRSLSAVLGLVIFSHWVLDLIVHLPDLPLLLNGSPQVGLGLWGTGPGLVLSGVIEILLLAGGTVVYLTWKKRKSITRNPK